MGSKLHQINRLFTTLQKNNCNVATLGLKASNIKAVSDNASLKANVVGGLNQLKGSMERLVDFLDRDSVRNTMLKHEEIFRQQLHELHRLYRVQKVLMTELGIKEVNLHSLPSETTATAVADTRTRIWSSASTSDTSHSSHVSNMHQSAPCSTRAGPSFDLEQPAEEYTSKGARSIKDLHTAMSDKQLKETSEGPLSWTIDDRSEIELTLSIGCGPNKKKRTHSIYSNADIGCSEPTRISKVEECGDSSAGLDRENLKSAPWLLQALNLNKR